MYQFEVKNGLIFTTTHSRDKIMREGLRVFWAKNMLGADVEVSIMDVKWDSFQPIL